ncbi:MAG: hypothetical protein A2Y12_14985 [Planctomycetes bacterium GWF2_42_9]|nr:MAG: hypothetical protein A2Y12_14985 [Planctomycetes bacterium GWF2_42_9]
MNKVKYDCHFYRILDFLKHIAIIMFMNKNVEQTCQQLIAAFFKAYPNPKLQNEVNRIMKRFDALKIPMHGKPGGWAGGIIYAITNQGQSPCGIPGVLNKECEDFFKVSMGTIHRRAYQVRELLLST